MKGSTATGAFDVLEKALKESFGRPECTYRTHILECEGEHEAALNAR